MPNYKCQYYLAVGKDFPKKRTTPDLSAQETADALGDAIPCLAAPITLHLLADGAQLVIFFIFRQILKHI